MAAATRGWAWPVLVTPMPGRVVEVALCRRGVISHDPSPRSTSGS